MFKESPAQRAMEEQDLIAETVKGNTQAFDELVRRYQDRLYNVLYRLCHNEDEAQDLAQDIFIKAYESLPSFEGKSSFYTWLYRIAANTFFSRHRETHAKRGIKVLPLVSAGEDGRRALAGPVATGPGPAQEVETRETCEIVQKAIDELPDDLRILVILKHLEGMEYQDVADVLRWPVGTVKSRLHRARSELKRMLEGWI